MGAAQYFYAYALAFGISLLSLFYARRQWQALRYLREMPDLPEAETRREEWQCCRRLLSSGFLLLIAILLVIAQIWLEEPAQRLADLRDKSDVPLDDAQRNFMRFYGAVWIAILLLLLGVVALAAFDLWSIRRYGLLQHRKLTEDRRAMIARQLRRLREEKEEEGAG